MKFCLRRESFSFFGQSDIPEIYQNISGKLSPGQAGLSQNGGLKPPPPNAGDCYSLGWPWAQGSPERSARLPGWRFPVGQG